MRFDPYDSHIGWHSVRVADYQREYRRVSGVHSPLTNAEIHAICELHSNTPMDTGRYRPVHDWIKAHERMVTLAIHIASLERLRRQPAKSSMSSSDAEDGFLASL